MTPPTPRFQRLFAELKRRRVFRVMGVYGGVAFVVLQVADLAFAPLGLPDWTMTLVVVLAMLGFPIAIVLAWAFETTPEGVRKTEPASVEEIEAIVAQPASKRWPSGLLALAGAVALASAAWWVGRQTALTAGTDPSVTEVGASAALFEAESDARPSIAVLPFLDMSPEGDQAYFSDGITEEILNTLVRIRDLKVAARTSAFAFRNRNLDMRAIGDSLGVAYLIEGSVRKAGEQLRITAQLIDAADGTHLWSSAYDRTMGDVFRIQTDIAESIAAALRVPLGLGNPSDLVTPTDDLDAYDLYLAARARMRERGESLAEAMRLFERAIARDSSWAPAWAGLAEALEVVGWTSNAAAWPEVPEDPDSIQAISEDFWRRSEQAAQRALELDPENTSAQVALGSILRNRLEWKASEDSYLQALATDPDNAEAYQQYSQLLWFTGRIGESVRAARRAVALDRAPVRLMELASALLAVGEEDEALEVVEEAVRLDSEGRQADILIQLRQLIALNGRRFESLRDLGREMGEPAELVDQVIDALQSGNLDGLPREFRQAAEADPVFLMILGRHEEAAARLLETTHAEPLMATQIMWMPLFDPIRQQPAYVEALRELNLQGRQPQRTPR